MSGGRWTRWAVGVVLLGATAIGACGGDGPKVDVAADPQLYLGQQLYLANCAQCHGDKGQGTRGLPRGPILKKVEQRYTVERQTKKIVNGAPGMPAWGNVLTADQIAAVVRYTREAI